MGLARDVLKSALERVLLAAGGRRGSAGAVLILAYHNVVPEGEPATGERSLHLSQRAFAEQLDLLQERAHVMPLDQALRGDLPPGRERPLAAITWDDAYTGALTAGVEELSRRGLPATIFVTPGVLGGDGFWWDALAGPDGAMDDGVRQTLLTECRGRQALIRIRAKERGWPWVEPPPHARPASTALLERAAATPGIALAAHSWSHANLAEATEAELTVELRRPLEWLRERFAGILPILAYPYGISSPLVEQQAAAAGYSAACRIAGGAYQPSRDLGMTVPRLNVPAGLSRAGFSLRLKGWLTR